MNNFVRIYLSFFLLISGQSAGSRDLPGTSIETNITDEFIYLHTDRSYYFPGETVLYKAYILEDNRNRINDTLYIAVINEDGLKAAYSILPLDNSLVSGNFNLPEYLSEGAYMLVASTRRTAASPERMFSKVINIITPESDMTTTVTLADSLYEPGSLVKARIRFSGKKNNPVSAGFTYHLARPNDQILSGDGKTDKTGTSTIEFRLPEFEKKDSLRLIIKPDKKKQKYSTGIYIPTRYSKSAEGSAPRKDDRNNLMVSIRTNRLPRNDNAEVEISVTDEKGIPVIANLSVSASAVLANQASYENDNLVSYPGKLSLSSPKLNFPGNSGPVLNDRVTEYFANLLRQITQKPGKSFIVQDKTRKKPARVKEAPSHKVEGYNSDRDIYDIIMQIKPYHLENNMIVFGMQSIYSINNPEGAIIVVDGIKMGTNASILGTIPVPDIAKISVSTNIMDIQRYSAMNTVGIIEITMKKSKEYLNIKEPPSETNTLFWGPDLITDATGKIFLSFSCNQIKDVLITVNGISAEGVPGSSSVNFQAR